MWQLKLIMHALGHYRPDVQELEREAGWQFYDAEIVAAVDAFRAAEGISTPDSGGSPPGLVDHDTVDRMWRRLEETGRADELRAIIRELTFVRR